MQYTIITNIIQLLTFVEVNIRSYRSEAEVNMIHLGKLDPYINRNESQ